MACMKDEELAQKSAFESKIKELESEMQELKLIKREPVLMPCDHEDEISQLQVLLVFPHKGDHCYAKHCKHRAE